MKKRTTIDFSNHELLITEHEDVVIHYLKKPNTCHDSIKYINTSGILAVTGDYGNWIFCREFIPSPQGSVSEQYWIEKLRNSSCQDPFDYSPDLTTEKINKRISELEEYGYEGEELEKAKEYYTDLLTHVDDFHEYISHARDYPRFMDLESMEIGYELKYWIKAVFDGFEEMCLRDEK